MIIRDKTLMPDNSIFKMCFYPLLIRHLCGTTYLSVPQKALCHHSTNNKGVKCLPMRRTELDADRLVKNDRTTSVREKAGLGVSSENLDAATVTAGYQKELSVRSDVEIPWMNASRLIAGISQSSVRINFEYGDSVILKPDAGI